MRRLLKKLLSHPVAHRIRALTGRRRLERADLEQDGHFLEALEKCRPYTMTSPERLYALYDAVRHISASRIPGSIVECGVWRGGSAMMAALALLQLNDNSRDMILYDTFEGMTEPETRDVDIWGNEAGGRWRRTISGSVRGWFAASREEVRANLKSTGFPGSRIDLIEGRVEDTIPANLPHEIAILRLDTDWYASTLHELTHLYPLLSAGGVLIIDDYGHWQGAREAVEQYFAQHPPKPFLARIDYTGRIAVKPD